MRNILLKHYKKMEIALAVLILIYVVFYYYSNRAFMGYGFDKQFKELTVSYMERKYGDHNFKVKNYSRNYEHQEISQMFDFSDKFFVGFYVTVTSDVVPETLVFVRGTDINELTMDDTFVEDYYAIKDGLDLFDNNYIFDKYDNWNEVINKAVKSEASRKKCEEFKNYLYSKSELINEVTITENRYNMNIILPNDMGHVPTEDELGNYVEISNVVVKANIVTINSEEFKETLKEYIEEYYNNTKTIDIYSFNKEDHIQFDVSMRNKS